MVVSKMRSRVLAGALAACILGVVSVKLAWATASLGVTTTIVSGPVKLGDIELKSQSATHDVKIKTKGDSDVYIVHNRIAPGGHTGWHSHPGVSFITVKAGQATEYHGDDPIPSIYAAGTGFTEEAGGKHIIQNNGDTDLELVAFQIIPAGAPRRIDEPAP